MFEGEDFYNFYDYYDYYDYYTPLGECHIS